MPGNPLAEFHCYIAMSYMTAIFMYSLLHDTRGIPVRLNGMHCRSCQRTKMPAETHSAALRQTATGTLTTPIAKSYMSHRSRGAHLLNTGNIRPEGEGSASLPSLSRRRCLVVWSWYPLLMVVQLVIAVDRPLTMSCEYTLSNSGRRMIRGETRYSMCAPC